MDFSGMDLNDLRIAITLLSFAVFAGIVGWAVSRRNRARFEQAQMLPFLDEPIGRGHDGRAAP
jgi:cytochrome c oxidase cbb3-type subunit 4